MNKVDNRVVDMQFNNQQFERGVKASVKSLDNLKKGLDLDGATKSLTGLSKASKSFSLAGMADNVDLIAQRFTNLGIVGMTAIQNLTNRALDAGIAFAKSLTIEPLTSGFDEYEIKMQAIQTLMTNTASKGTTLTQINEGLAELNEYADLTIYNFAQMTDNASKFTAAGVGFEDSLTTVKGMANVAAGFGVNAERMAGATYQMTQALAAGVVKLQDWNSMTQAGMGGEMIQNELKATAKGMGIFVDANIPFRESLEKGWLTSEVFVKTMDKMAKDPGLLLAATNVTTFTKLLGTMKEAVGSGWASTWEQIIGDKEQSTRFFTAIANGFSAIVGESAKARNAMFSFWNINGGRTAFVTGLANALEALSSVIAPIEKAFRDIFPGITAQRLIDLSIGFRDLMENLKMGEGASENLRKTFTGLFAVVDIIITVISQALSIFGLFSQGLAPIGQVILFVTGAVGDFIVALRNIIKTLGAFSSEGLNAMADLFQTSFTSKIGGVIQKIADAFKNLFPGISGVASVTDYASKTLETLIAYMNKLIDKSQDVGTVMIQVRDDIFGFTKSLFGYGDKTKEVSEGNKTIGDSFNSISSTVNKTGSSLSNAWESALNKMKSVWTFIEPLRNALSNAFKSLTDSIFKDMQDLTVSKVIDGVEGLLAGGLLLALRRFIVLVNKALPDLLQGATDTLNGVRGALKSWQTNLRAQVIMNLAIAVGILAAAIFVLSKIEPEKMNAALIATAILFAEVTVALAVLSKVLQGAVFKSMFQVAIAMTGLATATLILSHALVILANIEWKKMMTGLGAILILMTMMDITSRGLATQSKGMISTSIALTILSVGIASLAGSIYLLSMLSWDQIEKGLQITTALIIGVVALGKSLAGTNILQVSYAILAIATSLNILTVALGILGNMNVNTLIQGFTSIAVALIMFTTVMRGLPASLVGAASTILAISLSLNVMAAAVAIFGNMNVLTIIQGLMAIIGVLTVLTIAMNAMRASIGAAPAMITLAAALLILSIPLKIMGTMNWDQMVIALTGLAGSLIILGAVAYALAPLAPVLMAIATGVLAFGGAIALTGIGVIGFAVGLGLLIGTITVLVPAIRKLGEAANALIEEIIKILPGVGAIFSVFIVELAKMVPAVVILIYALFDAILKIIVEYTEPITTAIVDILIAIVDAIEKREPEIASACQYLIRLIIKGLKAAIIELGNPLVALGEYIQGLIFEGMSAIFGDPRKQVIVPIVEGLEKGVQSESGRTKQAGVDIGNSILDGTKQALDSHSPSLAYEGLGIDAINGLNNGLYKNVGYVYKAGFVVGQEATKGTKDGLGNMGGILSNTLSSIAQKIKDGLKLPDIAANITKPISELTKGLGSATSKGAKESAKQAKTAFEISKEWIDEKKYYNNLSLDEELAAWERIQKRYKEGTDERKEANREIYRLNQEIMTKSLDDEDKKNKKAMANLVRNIDNMKFYKQLDLKEELRLWELNQTTFSAGSEERVKAEKEFFRLKDELRVKDIELAEKNRKDAISKDLANIEDKKFYGEMNFQQELDALLKIRNLRTLDRAETKDINKKIFVLRQNINQQELTDAREVMETKKFYGQLSLQQELDAELALRKSRDMTGQELIDSEKKEFTLRESIRAKEITTLQKAIADKKELNKSSLSEELAAQREIRDNKNANVEDILAADKEIARIEKEINDTNLDYTKKVKDLETKTNDERIKMEEEYYKKTKEINDKLKEDVRKVGEEYTKALESRSKTLYDSFGLFDKVDPKKLVKGSTLVKNLQGQVKEFETWQSNINLLGSKGVSKGLIDELQAMGPKATAEIKALNTLSTPELDLYVSLWKTKHEEAKTQATKELEGLRLETVSKIKELETAAQGELSTYTKTWFTALEKLRLESGTQLDTLALEWAAKIGPIRTATETEFTTLVTNVKSSLTSPNWSGLGADIVDGVRSGMMSKAAQLAADAAALMIATLEAAKLAVESTSPSKKFAELGGFCVLGLVQGLRAYTGNAVIAVKDLANTTLSALGLAMAETSSVMTDSLDTNPVIRPVLDLSNITSGASRMSALLSGTSGINVGSVNAKIPVMTQPDSVVQSSQNGSTSAPNIAFTQNNYSPKELSRFEIYRQTRNQLATMKGLVSST